MTTRSTRARLGAGAALTLALGTTLALMIPLSASAHVTLEENTAEPGSYALLTFKVPTESETATTTSVTVTLPSDTPFVSVATVPVPGWDAQVVTTTLPKPVQIGDTTVTEAPTSIVWTATGEGLRSGELGLFPFSVGPVPDVGSIGLPVEQGYSDGSVVPWTGDDTPTLYVNDPPVAHHDDDGDGDAAAPDDHASAETPAASGPDATAIAGVVLGSLGFLLGAAGLAVALINRRPAS